MLQKTSGEIMVFSGSLGKETKTNPVQGGAGIETIAKSQNFKRTYSMTEWT
jgi:hypothetical protein